jgi:hypothetical protein
MGKLLPNAGFLSYDRREDSRHGFDEQLLSQEPSLFLKEINERMITKVFHFGE